MVVLGGKVIVFAGYAGAGKNSIIKELLVRDSRFTYIPSVTTREKREGESEGSPYYYRTLEEFKALEDRKRFLESESIHGNWYGSLIDKYEEKLESGAIVLKDIGVEGALRMREIFGDDAVLVFITPTDVNDVENRMRLRGDSENDIVTRQKRVAYEKSFIDKFDHVVVNDVLEDAVEKCLGLLADLSVEKKIKTG